MTFYEENGSGCYELEEGAIERLLEDYGDEPKHDGYILSGGKRLKEFNLQFAHVINEVSNTTQLGLSDFRAELNVGMLLTESEAGSSMVLDIVMCFGLSNIFTLA